MRPIDYRNETFEQLLARGLVNERLAVYQAFQKHGPGTTREVARKSGIDILNLRPRATELYQLGFLKLVEDPRSEDRDQMSAPTSDLRLPTSGAEGTYRAYTWEEAKAKFFVDKRGTVGAQQKELQLGT
jgi:predicted transcriptional regulator